MTRSKKINPSPMRKQSDSPSRKRATQSPQTLKKSGGIIQPLDDSPLPQNPKLAEQEFRERQAAASTISKHIMDEMQKTDPRALNRRSCWLLVNEVYDRLCCCNDKTSLGDLQIINRILVEQSKLRLLERKAKPTMRKNVNTRSGPLPETLARAIHDLYGGTIKIREPNAPQNPNPTDDCHSPPLSGLTIDKPPTIPDNARNLQVVNPN